MKPAAWAFLAMLPISDSSAAEPLPEWSRLARRTGTDLRTMTPADGPTGWAFGRTRGRPKATIICLHGIQTHADWFAPLGEIAGREGYLLLCPDRRGSGRQAAPDRVARLARHLGGEVWAEDLRPVCAAAGRIGAPVFLLGTSWGAKVALYAAAEREQLYPGLDLRGLILLVPATPASKEAGLLPRIVISLGNCFFPDKTMRGLQAADYVCAGTAGPPPGGAWLREQMTRDSGQQPAGGLLLDQGQTPHLLHEGLRLQKLGLAAGSRHPLPTLALLARGDQVVDAKSASRRLHPLAGPPVWLEGAGHAVQVEAPASIMAKLAPWLEDCCQRPHAVSQP